MKHFIGIVHKDLGTAFGIHFPDLPGCVSASVSLDALIGQAQAAIALYLEDADPIDPRGVDAIREVAVEDLKQGAFLLAVPAIALTGRSKRANITLDAGLLNAIDETAKARGLTRSAFLADLARREIV